MKPQKNTVDEAFERNSEIDELSCFCVMRHINTMIRQMKYERVANLSECCEGCPKYFSGECGYNWLWNMMPIAKKARLMPNVSPSEYRET